MAAARAAILARTGLGVNYFGRMDGIGQYLGGGRLAQRQRRGAEAARAVG